MALALVKGLLTEHVMSTVSKAALRAGERGQHYRGARGVAASPTIAPTSDATCWASSSTRSSACRRGRTHLTAPGGRP